AGLAGRGWLAGAGHAIVSGAAVVQPSRVGADCCAEAAAHVWPLVQDAIRRPATLVLLPRVAGPSAASISSGGADMSGAGVSVKRWKLVGATSGRASAKP